MKKSYICNGCGAMVSPADTHKCPALSNNLFNPADEEYIETGETIEQVRNGKASIRRLESDIIEAAVAYCQTGITQDDQAQAVVKMFKCVDAYHAALRDQAREGK